jgi:alkylhydroperoxidase family enzyme
MATPGDQFDSDQVQTDIARIRATLKRLDQEHRAAVAALEKAIKRTERTIALRAKETRPRVTGNGR